MSQEKATAVGFRWEKSNIILLKKLGKAQHIQDRWTVYYECRIKESSMGSIQRLGFPAQHLLGR
jgi:hypothetical protein